MSRLKRVEGSGRVVVRPCSRCGVDRVARPNAVLCRDCVSVLGAGERKLWAA